MDKLMFCAFVQQARHDWRLALKNVQNSWIKHVHACEYQSPCCPGTAYAYIDIHVLGTRIACPHPALSTTKSGSHNTVKNAVHRAIGRMVQVYGTRHIQAAHCATILVWKMLNCGERPWWLKAYSMMSERPCEGLNICQKMAGPDTFRGSRRRSAK